MKELSRLVKFIGENGQSSNVMINLQDETTLESKLFKLLQSGKVTTDEEAARALYSTSSNANSYRMLKSRFRKKLYNHLHFLQTKEGVSSSSNWVEYQCSSLLLEAHGLRLSSELKLSIKVLEQAEQLAEEYELIEYKIRIIEEKRLLHMSLGNNKSYEHYNKLLPELYKKQIYYREATALHSETIIAVQSRVSDRAVFLKNFSRILLRMEDLWKISSSSAIFRKLHMLRILYLEQTGNYREIVNVVSNAEQLLHQKEINPHWFNKRYNSYIHVYALLQSRQYEWGLKLAEESIEMFRKYSTNWYGFMENFVLLTMHSKDYGKTAQLLLEATVGAHFEKLPNSSRERWELYRRFFVFMHSAYNNKLYKVPPEVSNNLILLPKDKAGFNLSLLVLEILEGLAEGRFEDLELQADRVRKYTAKYLKGEKAERPRLFMRMLQLALKGKNMDVVRQQGNEMLQKLQETPLPGDAFAEVEVVSYEHLWEVTLHLLEKHKP